MSTVSDHDRDLIGRINAGSARGVVVADDPSRVVEELASAVTVVGPTAQPDAVAAARVRVAEVLVDRAERAEVAAPEPGWSPSVRAAEAHLRRQLATWKLSWWDRGEPVPDRTARGVPVQLPLTVLAVDVGQDLDEGALATMTTTVPAAVRVVVLRART